MRSHHQRATDALLAFAASTVTAMAIAMAVLCQPGEPAAKRLAVNVLTGAMTAAGVTGCALACHTTRPHT
jgi:hypothetical protein